MLFSNTFIHSFSVGMPEEGFKGKPFLVTNLKKNRVFLTLHDAVNLQKMDINSPMVKAFRNMKYVASTWDALNQCVSDSNYEDGRRIISFSHILKYETFPLADIIRELLIIGQHEMKAPVEIEFAVNMDVPYGEKKIFNFLQIRPIAENHGDVTMNWDSVDTDDSIIYAESALGIGAVDDVKSIVYVKLDGFDSSNTEKIAEEILKVNNKFKELQFLLIRNSG